MFENLSFRQIRDLKKDLGGYDDVGINDFSTMLNAATGTNSANAGHGNRFETGVKHFSAGYDDFLSEHAGGVQKKLGDAGAALFGAVNDHTPFTAREEVGRQVGEEALRGALDFAPMALSAFGPIGFGVGATMSSALGAANAAEKTDSTGQTLLAAAMPWVGGPVSKVGAKVGLGAVRQTAGRSALMRSLGFKGGEKIVGQEALKTGGREFMEYTVAQSAADRVVGGLAGETAINVAAMLAGGGVDYNDTGDWSNPFTTENMLANLVDPTLAFGVAEVMNPTVLSKTRVDDIGREIKHNSASLEHEALNEVRPTLTGDTIAEIETQYETLKGQLENITNRAEKDRTRLKLEEARNEAHANIDSATRDTVSTLFGRKINTELEPLTREELNEAGVAVEVLVTPAEVLIPKTDKVEQVELTPNQEAVVKAVESRSNDHELDLARLAMQEGLLQSDVETAEFSQLMKDYGVKDEATAAEFYAAYKHKKLRERGFSDDAIVRAEKVINGEAPKTLNEAIELVENVNVIRKQAGQSVITDETINAALSFRISQGDSPEQAQVAMLQAIRNDIDRLVNRKTGKRISEKQALGKEVSAIKGAARGGRKEADFNKTDKEDMAWLDSQTKEILPDDVSKAARKAEVDLVSKYHTKAYRGEQKKKFPVYLARTYRKWVRNKDAGYLFDEKTATRQENMSEQDTLDILERMLYETWRNSGKDPTVKRVKRASDSEFNTKFDTEDEANDIARALEAKGINIDGKNYQIKVNRKLAKGQHLLEWRPAGKGFEAYPQLLSHKIVFQKVDIKGPVEEAAVSAKAEIIKEAVEDLEVTLLNTDNLTSEELGTLHLDPSEDQINLPASKETTGEVKDEGVSIANSEGVAKAIGDEPVTLKGKMSEITIQKDAKFSLDIKDGATGTDLFLMDLDSGGVMELVFRFEDGELIETFTEFEGGRGEVNMEDFEATYRKDPQAAADDVIHALDVIQNEVDPSGFDDADGSMFDDDRFESLDDGFIDPDQQMLDDMYGDLEQFNNEGSVIERFERAVTPRAVMNRLLSDAGLSEAAIKSNQDTFEGLFDNLSANDVDIFSIAEGDVRGAADIDGPLRRVFLSSKGLKGLSARDKVDALNFVTGHELAHTVEQLHRTGQLDDATHKQFDNFVRAINEGTDEDRQLMLEFGVEMLPKHMRTTEVVEVAKNSYRSPEEVRANLLSMWANGQGAKPDSFVMNLMPRPMRQGFKALTNFAKNVYGAMKGTGSVFANFRKQTELRANVDRMSDMATSFKDMHRKAVEFEVESSKLSTFGPPHRSETLAYWTEESYAPDDRRSAALKAFDETIMTFDQLAASSETISGINRVLHDFSSGVKASTKRTIGAIVGDVDDRGQPIFTSDGTTDITLKNGRKLTKLDFEAVRDSPKLNRLASDWMRRQNDVVWNNDAGEARKGKKLNYEDLKEHDKKLHEKLQLLSESDRNAIVQTVHRFGEGMKHFTLTEAGKAMKSGNISVLKAMIGSRHPDKWRQATAIAENLQQSIDQLSSGDPVQMEQGKHILSQIASSLEPDTFKQLIDTAREQNHAVGELLKQFKARDYFFSEIRQGKHLLRWKEENGEIGALGFETLKDLKDYERKLLDRRATMLPTDSVRRGVPHMSGEDKLGEMLTAYDQKNRAIVETLGLPDEVKDKLTSMMDYSGQFNKELASQDLLPFGSDRRLAGGREDLDMIQTQLAYFNSATRSLHKKVFNNELNYQLTNPDMQDAKVQSQMPLIMSYIENFLTPDTALGTTIAKANTAYYLGFNLSNHLIEFAQPAFSFTPELQAQGFGFIESNRMITDAQQAVGQYTMNNLPSRLKNIGRKLTRQNYQGRDSEGAWHNKDYADLMRIAAENDWISLGHAADVVEADVNNGSVDLTNLVGRNGRGQSRKDLLKRRSVAPIKMFANSSIKLYQQFTEHNARVSLIVGYEAGRKKGMGHEEAIQFAGQYSRTVTFSGGKANRPNKPFANKGSFRTAGQAMMSLSSYTFNMLSMMRRYAETGFSKRQYPHLTAADRSAARKALLTMVSTQFAGAGLVGLPFVGAATALFAKMTGINLEEEMREGLGELLNEDEKNDGGMLTDLVMSGAANAILGQVFPGSPDVGSRFAIGGILGVNSYDGFSMSALAGPTGSMVNSFAEGATSLIRDRSVGDAVETAMPLAFRKVAEMVNNGGEFRDDADGLLIDANLGEKIAYASGFAPQRIRKLKQAERSIRDQERRSREKDIRFYDELSKLYHVDPIRVMNELNTKAENSPKVELLRKNYMPQEAEVEKQKQIREGAKKVSERIEKQTHARDPRRAGTFNATANMQGMIAATGQGGRASEMQRLSTRSTVMTSLGFGEAVTPKMRARASLIDQILSKNVNMPYPQAALLADRHLKRNPAVRQALGVGL